jgi:hypothetical protein
MASVSIVGGPSATAPENTDQANEQNFSHWGASYNQAKKTARTIVTAVSA